jgi:hypothetical protein
VPGDRVKDAERREVEGPELAGEVVPVGGFRLGLQRGDGFAGEQRVHDATFRLDLAETSEKKKGIPTSTHRSPASDCWRVTGAMTKLVATAAAAIK